MQDAKWSRGNRDIIHVSSGGDAHVAAPFMAMVASLLSSNTDAPIHLHVLDAGIRAITADALDRLCLKATRSLRVNWVPVSMELLTCHHSRREAFIRLMIPDLLPQLDRVLWLDCDTLVVSDLAELWNVPLEGLPLAAVKENGARTLSRMIAPEMLIYGGRDISSLAGFNSGIMVLDLVLWRRDAIAQEVLDLSRRYASRLLCADQDGLNAVLAGKWKAADLPWNVQVGAIRSMPHVPVNRIPEDVVRRRKELIEHPRIIHFAGDKPWRSGLLNPFRRRYFAALKQSGFYGPLEFYAHHLLCTCRAALFFGSRKVCKFTGRLVLVLSHLSVSERP